jgi:hypothetical protein
LLLKAKVPEPTVIHGLVDSLASGLHPSASSCDTRFELELDDTDDASDGLSMMAKEIHSDGSVSSVKGQRSNIFQSKCKIQDKVCKYIIDGGSFANVISSDLVNALSLPKEIRFRQIVSCRIAGVHCLYFLLHDIELCDPLVLLLLYCLVLAIKLISSLKVVNIDFFGYSISFMLICLAAAHVSRRILVPGHYLLPKRLLDKYFIAEFFYSERLETLFGHCFRVLIEHQWAPPPDRHMGRVSVTPPLQATESNIGAPQAAFLSQSCGMARRPTAIANVL